MKHYKNTLCALLIASFLGFSVTATAATADYSNTVGVKINNQTSHPITVSAARISSPFEKGSCKLSNINPIDSSIMRIHFQNPAEITINPGEQKRVPQWYSDRSLSGSSSQAAGRLEIHIGSATIAHAIVCATGCTSHYCETSNTEKDFYISNTEDADDSQYTVTLNPDNDTLTINEIFETQQAGVLGLTKGAGRKKAPKKGH